MAALIKIATPQKYEEFKLYLEWRNLPNFETVSAKKTFLKQASRMKLLNNRIFIFYRRNYYIRIHRRF